MEKKETPGNEICAVCGDSASGNHYGVTACFGCKGFFRRTIRAERTFVCRFEGKCEVNKLARNMCRACRFQRCLEVGMEPDAIRPDRDKTGRQQYRRGTGSGRPKKDDESDHSASPPPEKRQANLPPTMVPPEIEPSTTSLVLSTLMQVEEMVNGFGEVETAPVIPTSSFTLADICQKPSILYLRHRLQFDGKAGEATWESVLNAARRMVVFWCDYLNTLLPMSNLSFQQKVKVVQTSSLASAFFVVGFFTAKSPQPSVIHLPNGTIISGEDPAVKSESSGDQSQLVSYFTKKFYRDVVRPIMEVAPTDVEYVSIRALLMANESLPLSEPEWLPARETRESVLSALFAHLSATSLAPSLRLASLFHVMQVVTNFAEGIRVLEKISLRDSELLRMAGTHLREFMLGEESI